MGLHSTPNINDAILRETIHEITKFFDREFMMALTQEEWEEKVVPELSRILSGAIEVYLL